MVLFPVRYSVFFIMDPHYEKTLFDELVHQVFGQVHLCYFDCIWTTCARHNMGSVCTAVPYVFIF